MRSSITHLQREGEDGFLCAAVLHCHGARRCRSMLHLDTLPFFTCCRMKSAVSADSIDWEPDNELEQCRLGGPSVEHAWWRGSRASGYTNKAIGQ